MYRKEIFCTVQSTVTNVGFYFLVFTNSAVIHFELSLIAVEEKVMLYHHSNLKLKLTMSIAPRTTMAIESSLVSRPDSKDYTHFNVTNDQI